MTLSLVAQGDLEVVITRTFGATREFVFDAHTRPELLQRWYGVRDGWTLPICEMDLRPDGRYLHSWRHETLGKGFRYSGIYREVMAPGRLVYTERLNDEPCESLVTMVLTEFEGRTTLQLTVRFESVSSRDAVLRSQMQSGLDESYDLLEQLQNEMETRS